MTGLLTFDSFTIGAPIGSERLVLSQDWVDAWYRIYRPGQPADRITAGLLMAVMMRGYMKIVAPRPPGNIQSRHCITFQNDVAIGATVQITLACTAKTLRKDRRWITFGGSMTADDAAVLGVEMDFLWAA